MLTSDPAWVAVLTHHNAETTVAERLRNADPPIECYLPMMVNKDKRLKHNSMLERPMFPNYLFARINDKQIYQTRTTRGVVCIVSSQHSIIQVPDREIEAVRMFESSQRKVFFHETSQLVKGARTTILEGEFAGMEGTLVKHCKDGNFCVSIDVMNLSIVVHVSRAELRPASDLRPEESKSQKTEESKSQPT